MPDMLFEIQTWAWCDEPPKYKKGSRMVTALDLYYEQKTSVKLKEPVVNAYNEKHKIKTRRELNKLIIRKNKLNQDLNNVNHCITLFQAKIDGWANG